MMKLRYVQTNLNHCRAAQDLLWEFIRVEDITVVLVSEPYDVETTGWHRNSSGQAVIHGGLTLDDV